jgi:hypothetical protein
MKLSKAIEDAEQDALWVYSKSSSLQNHLQETLKHCNSIQLHLLPPTPPQHHQQCTTPSVL